MRLPLSLLAISAVSAAASAQTPAPVPAPPPVAAPAPPPPSVTTTLAQPQNIAPTATRFTRCLAAARPAQVDAYLATIPGSPGETQAIDALVPVGDRACAADAPAAGGGLAAIPVMFLRGGLAEARYLARHADAPPPAIAGAQPANMGDEVFRARLATAADPSLELTRLFGDCVVAAWAPGVDHLIRTEAGSAAELAAITALQTAMGSCLYQNQTIPFTRETLRAPLADALYRKAAGVAAAASPVQAPAELSG